MQVSQLIITNSSNDHQNIAREYLKTQQNQNTNAEESIDSSINSPHIEWVNTEGETLKIKAVRNIISQGSYASYHGKTRYYILLHVDKATIAAQNALLKIIEEPPAKTIILLTTSNPDKIIPTIRSRCVTINLQTTIGTDEQNDPFIQKLTNKPNEVSYGDIIEFVEKYKDRDKAIELLLSQLKQNHLLPHHKKHLLQAHTALEKNYNVRLTLEHFLFLLKNRSS